MKAKIFWMATNAVFAIDIFFITHTTTKTEIIWVAKNAISAIGFFRERD
jgi:hypothetical protein